MTTRNDISIIHNKWNDAQRVDKDDLDTEQNRNIQTDSAIVNNFFGSGILPSSAVQTILFNSNSLTSTQASLLASGDFDGTGLQVHTQPTDLNLGNQLEVELSGSTGVFGRFSTKVLVVGLDFNNVTQYDRFTFYKNEKQVSKKHYVRILGIFFNDFLGNNNCSRNLGGSIVISESSSYQLSRDPIMVAQDVEPNLFFRDFKVPDSTVSLFNTIQAGIGPEFSVDSLDINTTVKINRQILPNDVTTRIGQKFKAVTNNIQKITLLLGASRDATVDIENRFDWTGDLVISIFNLQTSINCPTDLVPELAIDFDPSPAPLVQLTFSQAELLNLGYVLTDVLQPVDFIFSSTQLGSTTNPIIVPGRFYTVTISRAGAATSGNIVTGVGNNKIVDSRLTLFNGVWVDVEEEDLWFQVWTNAAKVADGSAFDAGNGIQIAKTEINTSGVVVDFAFDANAFADNGENTLNTAVVQAIQEQQTEEQDERTGNPVFARQKFEPEFSFVTNADLATLQVSAEPLIIGCAQDTNPKQNSTLSKTQDFPGLAKGDIFKVVNPDADLLSLNLLGSKLIPNVSCDSFDYRIFRVLTCTDGYGDINGDGIIDANDIARATALLGESLDSASTQQKIVDGEIDTLEMLRADVDGDGYITSADVTLITNFVARTINAFPVGAEFTHMEIQVQQSIGRFDGYFDCDGYIRLDGYEGRNIVSPSSLDPFELIYDGYIVTPSIEGSDSTFTTVPFPGVTFRVEAQPFWQDYLMAFGSDARVVPASLTFDESIVTASCSAATLFECTDRVNFVPICDPGRNDIMFPDNIILRKGDLLRPDGSFYPVDLEVGQVILQLPETQFIEANLNIFDKFVAEAADGKTNAGEPSMRYSDCSAVQPGDLALNRVRFDVSIQSISYNLDGYDDDGYGVIVNEGIRAVIDHATGILTFTVNDLFEDPIFTARITKIQITVYLKKAGWNNTPLVINSSKIAGLIS